MGHVFDTLNPGSKAPKTEQYNLAWKALGDAVFNASDRQQAKCWLTYRAVDGEVTFFDWLKHVDPVQLPQSNAMLQTRWDFSQAMAEMYLGIIAENYALADKSYRIMREYVDGGRLAKWPAAGLNILRASTLRIYQRYLNGETVGDHCRKVFQEWAEHFRYYGTPEAPIRWCEIMDATPCLKALAYIAEKEGCVKITGAFGNHPHKAINHASTLPWARCMYALGVGSPRVLWIAPSPEEGRLVDQYRQIHATKRYGPGGLKPEWVEVYKRLTQNLEVRSVIDYGCGRSKDIEHLWPGASHAFYDPAIPGLDKMPDGSFSLGYCTQVMEHIPEEEVQTTFEKMKRLSPWWVMSIHMHPANQILPNGENAHCTQKTAEWWAAEFQKVMGGKIHTEPMTESCFYLTNLPQHD